MSLDTSNPTDTAPSTSRQPVEPVRRLVTSIPGPKSQAAHERRRGVLASGLGTTMPVYIERAGEGVLVDIDGNHIVDLASGIAVTSVGAAAPEVAAAVAEQAAAFTHTCFLVTPYESYVDVAAWLNEHAPIPGEVRSALFSTGAEAVENALKIARAHTGRPGVVVFDNAFHGRTIMTLAMTAKEKPYKTGAGPFPEQVHRAPFPTALRWPEGPEKATDQALQALSDLVESVGADQIAAFVIEPIQGEGGFLSPTPGFLQGVQDLARKHGIVFVCDEIQAGVARTGAWFACEHEGLEPDLMTTAKALGGGMPISGVTGRAEIMDSIVTGGLGGTYAGNPTACAAALAAVEKIEREGLLERAARAHAAASTAPERTHRDRCPDLPPRHLPPAQRLFGRAAAPPRRS